MNSDSRIARREVNQSRCRKAVAVVALLATCGLLAAAASQKPAKDPPCCTADNQFKAISATIHSPELGGDDNMIALDQLQYMYGELKENEICTLGVGTFELLNPGGSLQVHVNDIVQTVEADKWYRLSGRVTVTGAEGSGPSYCIYRRI